ncbi:helix-turn-helix domain-containing protein [Chloroflexota bacterium]
MQDRTDRNAKDRQYLLKIGDNIRTVRKQRGYSQEEFADIAGFSRSYYTEIETGKRNISVLNLIKIIKALKVDPNELIGFLKPK